MDEDKLSGLNNGSVGLFHGGGGYSLGIQAAAMVSIIAWSMLTTSLVLGVGTCTQFTTFQHGL